MVAYGMGVLQLIKLLKAAYSVVNAGMHSHDAGYSGYVGKHRVIIQFTKIIRLRSRVLPQTLKKCSYCAPRYSINQKAVWLVSQV